MWRFSNNKIKTTVWDIVCLLRPKARHRAISKIDLGPARLQCVDILFDIVGSVVHRKDDELGLSIGEALVKYADGIGTGEWSSAT